MADAIYLLKHLYIPGSPTPPPPFDECGKDPTVDEIDCVSHPCMDSVRTDGLRRIRTDKLDKKILPEQQLQKERGNR
jgi:hypothetical protein